MIISYISNNYEENLTLTSIANRFGVSKYSLSRMFSNVLGVSFYQYINLLRIDFAEILLVNTDLSITDIAIKCGYNNQQTFNRAFKDRNKTTPSMFRKKMLNS